jgi:hypothetical protein
VERPSYHECVCFSFYPLIPFLYYHSSVLPSSFLTLFALVLGHVLMNLLTSNTANALMYIIYLYQNLWLAPFQSLIPFFFSKLYNLIRIEERYLMSTGCVLHTQISSVFSLSYLIDCKHKISKIITSECDAYFLDNYIAGMNVDFLNCMSISRFNNGLCC